MITTYSTAQVAAMICGDSMGEPERWVIRQITLGRFTARRVGRTWRMTEADITAALDTLANRSATPVADDPATDPAQYVAGRRRLAVAQ